MSDGTGVIPEEDGQTFDEPGGEELELESGSGKSGLRVTVEWVAVLGGALALALVLRAVLFQAYYIQFSSMETTLSNGDRVLVNKLGDDIFGVNRGNLVVFERPPGTSGRPQDDLIKRVIGLPGEIVEFREGDVFIDGRRLHEPYLSSPGITAGRMPSNCAAVVGEGCLIGPNEVFVMGDNRVNSTDSRMFGPISKEWIVGQAFLRIWPLNEFGRL